MLISNPDPAPLRQIISDPCGAGSDSTTLGTVPRVCQVFPLSSKPMSLPDHFVSCSLLRNPLGSKKLFLSTADHVEFISIVTTSCG
jgi:hypothetical protein